MDNVQTTQPSTAGERTQSGADIEADLLLEQLQQQLTHVRAPDPGTLRDGDVLSKTIIVDGDGTDTPTKAPVPQTVTVTSAGYVWVYDRTTGERSRANANPSSLKQLLRKLGRDTKVMFTTVPPERWPNPPTLKRGGHKCYLHADDPNRATWDQLGLAVCTKANLLSRYEVERHMKHRHKSEWASIETERLRAKEDEERAWRQAVLQQAGGLGTAMLAAAEPTRTPRKGAA